MRLTSVAAYFAEPATDEELLESLAFAKRRNLSVTVIGEGSNVVLGAEIPGLTLRVALQGTGVDRARVKARAGVNWDRLVSETLALGAFGLENLVLIPGTAGAAPIQNIGAYGVELSTFVREVRAIHRYTLEPRVFSTRECAFAYRDSLFKGAEAEMWVITDILMQLRTEDNPDLSHKGVEAALDAAKLAPSALSVAKVIAGIRRGKLPDPAITPNVGSFFKNPVVAPEEVRRLRSKYPRMPAFEVDGGYRIPAAWLVEMAGLKGRSLGGVMVSDRHALVLTNTGEADALAVHGLAEMIRHQVAAHFSIVLEQEPRNY